MTELPALAGSEGYAACDDGGALAIMRCYSKRLFASNSSKPSA